MEELINYIVKQRIGKVETNVSLKRHTTYRIGGIAKVLVHPKNIYKLGLLLKFIKEQNIRYFILGSGSNIIVSDHVFDGVMIKLDELNHCEWSYTTVTVGAGYSLQKLSSMAARKGYSGLEFAAGIPGSVGGAVYMNAGAYQSDMGYITRKVKVITENGTIKTLYNRDMDFHYRTSILQQHKDWICVEATLVLKKGNKKEIQEVMEDRKQRRLISQPLEYPSAGSVFRNPENNYAGKLIEDANLKGKRLGGAMVSEKHANFIINYDRASAQDIKDLIMLVQREVEKKYHIKLKIEQEFVNW